MGSPNVCIIVTSDSISRFIPTFIPTALVLLAVVLDPARAQGQTAADLFNPDGVFEGLHWIVEYIDTPFLARVYDSDQGNL